MEHALYSNAASPQGGPLTSSHALLFVQWKSTGFPGVWRRREAVALGVFFSVLQLLSALILPGS